MSDSTAHRPRVFAVFLVIAFGWSWAFWGLWQLPLFYIPERTIYYQKSIWGFVVSIAVVTLVMTWLYDRTGGSLLAMLLAHTSFNWTTSP